MSGSAFVGWGGGGSSPASLDCKGNRPGVAAHLVSMKENKPRKKGFGRGCLPHAFAL